LTDPSETLAITIAGVPTGATLSAGTDQGGGIWALTPAQLAGLTLTPPANSDSDFTLTVTATATDGASIAQHQPEPGGHRRRGRRCPTFRFAGCRRQRRFADRAVDHGGAHRSVRDPEHRHRRRASRAVLNHGTNQGGGIWTLTAGQLSGLTITPPANSDSDFTLTVTATSTDTGGVQASASGTIAVAVARIADTPTLSVAPASGNEDAPIALSIAVDPGRHRRVGDARHHGERRARGCHAQPRHRPGRRGVVAHPAQLAGSPFTPPANSDTDFTLSVTATRTDTGGLTAATSTSLAVIVAPVADTPTLTFAPASGNEDSPIALSITRR
jgi:hypothetical protein